MAPSASLRRRRCARFQEPTRHGTARDAMPRRHQSFDTWLCGFSSPSQLTTETA